MRDQCPLFEAERFVRCRAVATEVTPTLHERERFCCADQYTHCPTLRAMLQLGRRLAEKEYLDLWIAPGP